MAELKIKKAKIIKEKSLAVEFIRIEDDKSVTKGSEEHGAEVHADLKKSYAALTPHLAIMAEFLAAASVTSIDKIDPEFLKAFRITGISIGGEEGDEGVILTGGRMLSTGKYLGMNTPFTRYGESEENGYKFIDDLEKKVKLALGEVNKYLTEGKIAEDPQQELPFGEAGRNVTHIQVAHPESDDERDARMLQNLRNNKSGLDTANPEAMKDVANMPNGQMHVVKEPVGELVENERESLRGKGKRNRL